MFVADSCQPVELEDGSTAYIALNGSVLNALSLDGFAALGGENHASGRAEDEEGELFVRDRAKSFMCPHEGCGKLYTTLHHLKVKLCNHIRADINYMLATYWKQSWF